MGKPTAPTGDNVIVDPMTGTTTILHQNGDVTVGGGTLQPIRVSAPPPTPQSGTTDCVVGPNMPRLAQRAQQHTARDTHGLKSHLHRHADDGHVNNHGQQAHHKHKAQDPKAQVQTAVVTPRPCSTPHQ